MEVSEYEKLVLYLAENKYEEATTESEKRRIRKRSKIFQVDKNKSLMYINNQEGEATVRTVITRERRKSVIKLMHTGHLGRDKTYEKCNSRFYWKGMKQDVAEFIKHCPECQSQNKKTKSHVQEMVPVSFPPRVWGKVGIDLIGPFMKADKKKPICKRGYRYVLTVMDYFCKWPEAFPLKSKTAIEVASKLHSTICRFGVMEEIVSDQGGEFNSKITKNFTQSYGIKHVTTSPYHPQSNGMVERFNQTLKNMLNKMIDKNGEDWDLFLEEALFHYRTSKHHSTQYSPFYVMFMRQPVLPNESAFKNTHSNHDEQDIEGAVNQMIKIKDKISKDVVKNVKKAQQKQKESYDVRHKVENKLYLVGDKVLLKNFRRKAGMATVQQLRYKGPYEITKYNGKGNYSLFDEVKGITIGPFNQRNLKKWYEEDVSTCSEGEEITHERDNEKDDDKENSNTDIDIDSEANVNDDDENVDDDDKDDENVVDDDDKDDENVVDDDDKDDDDVDDKDDEDDDKGDDEDNDDHIDAHEEDAEDSIFKTQDRFQLDDNESQTDQELSELNEVAQFLLESQPGPSRPKRKRKQRKNSLYEYF